jgi:drug/metabolite transporter (DMT)-like permease
MTLNGRGRQRLGDFLIGVATALWGFSYYVCDLALASFGPLTLTALRFCGAFVIVCVALFPKLKSPSRATLRYAALIGLVLLYIYSFSNYGLLHTSVSNAGFLSNLGIVFTPLISAVFLGKKPDRKLALCIALCCAGIALLTLSDRFVPGFGDVLCLLCSIGCAAHLLLTERAVSDARVTAIQLGVYEIGFCAVFTTIAALLFERDAPGGLLHLPTGGDAWIPLVLLTVLCTAFPFVIQPIAQQWTGAMRAGVIFSMEPVVAGIAGFFLAHEILLARNYAGAGLVVLSLVFMELELPFMKAKAKAKVRKHAG